MNPRTALVTGATGELGAAIARRLVALGHQVVLAARNDDAARTLADKLGAGTRWVSMDVTDAASVAAAAKTVDHVDIVINNAGVLLDDGGCAATVDLEVVERTPPRGPRRRCSTGSSRPTAGSPWSRREGSSRGTRRRR